jgi:hypothetical protein
MIKAYKLGLLLAVTGFFSCKKVENKVFYTGGTASVVTSSTNAVRLEPAEEKDLAITFNWTNPNYQFTTGLSSQDVSYSLELDTLGGNFASTNKYATTIAKETTKSFTQEDLNKILGNIMNLQTTPRRVYTMEARIISSINGAVKLISSNKITFTVSPFTPPPLVEPPTNGNLWITGSATLGSWAEFPNASQKFTKQSNTLYDLTLTLPGGGGYKLLQESGWSSQYHKGTGTWEAGTVVKGDSDPAFDGPPAGGSYKITVDFQKGTYTVVQQ